MRTPGTPGRPGGSDPPELSLLVDPAANRGHPELDYLLSFGAVEGLELARLEELTLGEDEESVAVLRSDARSWRCAVRPLGQFQKFGERLAAEDEPSYDPRDLTRAMTLAYLARRDGADAVVSPTADAFAEEPGMISGQRLLTVDQALAIVGAFVRLRPRVPLGGDPLLLLGRSGAYRKTVSLVIPSARGWWRACVSSFPSTGPPLLLAQTTLSRAGQALRGRDSIHEGLRRLEGTLAVDEALYHLDVVLMSCVAAFDALARLVNEVFGVDRKARDCGWQKDHWLKDLANEAPALASLVDPARPTGAKIRFITRLRNSIHGIALSEGLHVDAATMDLEHRVSMPEDLVERLEGLLTHEVGPAEAHGVFLSDSVPVINPALLAERVVLWTVEVLDDLMATMLQLEHPPPAPPGQLSTFREDVDAALPVLAQIGGYPTPSGRGIPARSPVQRSIRAAIHRARLEVGRGGE